MFRRVLCRDADISGNPDGSVACRLVNVILASLSLMGLIDLSACATAPRSRVENLTGFDLMLKREYQQLAGLNRPSAFSRDTHKLFAAKAAKIEKGECVEPEEPAAWRRADTISVTLKHESGTDEVLGTVALRSRLLADGAKASTASDKIRSAFPDLDVARAHALGRYDCIVAFGRNPARSGAADFCLAEYARSSLYLERAAKFEQFLPQQRGVPTQAPPSCKSPGS